MTMSPEAQKQYDAAMMAAAIKHGTMVSRNPSFYGWSARPWSGDDASDCKHMEHCQFVPGSTSAVEEDDWNEFMGTFYEGDTTKHGVIVKGVSCACGEIKDRSVRWQADMQEVAEAVFEEAFGPKD